jgi:Limiting CO2-inducible proteins B/C beta carbonyic anhydrases
MSDWVDFKCTDKVLSVYPKAIPNIELVNKVSRVLAKHGYGPLTLVATSLCCDEVNRVLEHDFAAVYGPTFSMGGLSGFPFGGITSFGSFASHIPDGGDCLVIFGPHVGIDKDGTVGKINRRGVALSNPCCGSACVAAGHVACVMKGEGTPLSMDVSDAQQTFVNNLLLPYGERLEKALDAMAELPLALFDAQRKVMDQILAKGCQFVAGSGRIALLGGIQINTPEEESDYFLPLLFELRSNKNEKIVELHLSDKETSSGISGYVKKLYS